MPEGYHFNEENSENKEFKPDPNYAKKMAEYERYNKMSIGEQIAAFFQGIVDAISSLFGDSKDNKVANEAAMSNERSQGEAQTRTKEQMQSIDPSIVKRAAKEMQNLQESTLKPHDKNQSQEQQSNKGQGQRLG